MHLKSLYSLLAAAGSLWLVAVTRIVAEVTPSDEQLHEASITSSDRSSFVELANQFDEHTQKYFRDLEAKAKTSPAEAMEYAQRNDEPSGDYVPKLLAYEEKHRGKLVGLMALRKIFRHAAQCGLPSETLRDGKREALIRLSAYVTTAELTETLRFLTGGGYREPAVEQSLREIADAPNALSPVRAFARYRLAEWMLGRRDFVEGRLSAENQIERFKAEDTPEAHLRARMLENELVATPNPETFAHWEKEATEILTDLKEHGNEIRATAVKNVDPVYHIIQVNPEKTKTMPTVAELASGLLLKEQHLRVGAMAQELELRLVDGKDWSLADHRRKVVVIQFSFTGCAPCKRMYPILQELQNDHSNSLSLLTIMRDEELETVQSTMSTDKITWNVYWDESPDRVTTNWAVTRFPTAYVIDREGRIAATPRSGEALKSAVVRLLR